MESADPAVGASSNLEPLSADQRAAVAAVDSGRNVFLSGYGGTGKSHATGFIVERLRSRGKNVAVTASTSIAALQIGGTTLHSLLKLELAEGPAGDLIARAMSNASLIQDLRATDLLVVDEISMLAADFFSKASAVVAALRGRPGVPFGGLQVLLVGDFAQLPPVEKANRPRRYCFQETAWRELNLATVELETPFRQKDPAFVELLGRVRSGLHDGRDVDLLRSRLLSDGCGPALDGVEPTRLYSRRNDVDDMNAHRLERLPGPAASFVGRVERGAGITNHDVAVLVGDAQAPRELWLKKGAQVVLLANKRVRRGLANGSRGVVVRFDAGTGLPVVQFEGQDKPVPVGRWTWHRVTSRGELSFTQIPLKLAWALTVHKCQGLSLDRADVALADVWEPGQAYVALSRVRSLEGLRLISFDAKKIRADPEVLAFYAALRRERDLAVAFAVPDDGLDDRLPDADQAVDDDDDGLDDYLPDAPAASAPEGPATAAAEAEEPAPPEPVPPAAAAPARSILSFFFKPAFLSHRASAAMQGPRSLADRPAAKRNKHGEPFAPAEQ